jgi:tetratricopeptide (TPR) repeat protein
MRNPFHQLLFAAALLLILAGCQSPLRPNETADLKPPKSLLGEAFDEDAARAKAEARRSGGQNSATVASTQAPTGRPGGSSSDIAQTGYRNETDIGQPAGSQLPTRPQQAQLPEAVAQHIREGAEAMARQDWANATFHYEAILSADSRNALAHQMLGRIGDQTQRFESAEYHYLRAIGERRDDPNLRSDLGYSYLQQGRLQEAKRELLKSLAIDANHQMAKANLAAVEAYLGNINAALALLKQISSEQEAHQTLHELLNRPAPAQKRDQQLLSQQGENLPIGEQLRIARDTGRAERTRQDAINALEMRERVRQAMAVGGPLNKMGQGFGDEEIEEIIAQIQKEDQQQPRSQQQQYATAPQSNPQFGGVPQFGAPPQSGTPSPGPNSIPPTSNPNQNYYPAPNVAPVPGSQDDWSTQTLPWSPGADAQQLHRPLYRNTPQSPPQNFRPLNSQEPPNQNWQQPGQNQLPGNQFPGNQTQWNSQPQGYNPTQNFNPARSELLPETQPQLEPIWRGPPENYQGPGGLPAPNNQQQFAPTSPGQGTSNPYQSFPNGQQQYAPPNQFQTPPPTSQPSTGFDSHNQYGGGTNDSGSQYVPPSTPGVWSPQGARNSYESQPGAIQQLGHQSPAGQTGSTTNRQARQNSVRQAMRLGMAAGPGSLIQMDGQSRTNQQQSGTAAQGQQFFPNGSQHDPGSPSSAVWNSGSNGAQSTSPNQNLWQAAPMSTDTRNVPQTGNGTPQQWQQLPSAQQQPQSSTWNHQNQQPTSAMRSQNWSGTSSPVSNWQPGAFGESPTLSNDFAPAHMLDANPALADPAPTMMTGFTQQGAPTTQNTGATRVPFTARFP